MSQSTKSNEEKKSSQGHKTLRPRAEGEEKARHCVTIGKSPAEVFAFWRNFANLPLFMKDLSHVTVTSAKRSHWVVTLKSGAKAEWDAEITAERDREMIAWKSTEGSEVQTSGTVWFTAAPADLGTEISLAMDYSVPGGKVTELAAKLSGEDPENLILTNLRRLKALLETGEIPTVEGQSSGRDEKPSVTH